MWRALALLRTCGRRTRVPPCTRIRSPPGRKRTTPAGTGTRAVTLRWPSLIPGSTTPTPIWAGPAPMRPTGGRRTRPPCRMGCTIRRSLWAGTIWPGIATMPALRSMPCPSRMRILLTAAGTAPTWRALSPGTVWRRIILPFTGITLCSAPMSCTGCASPLGPPRRRAWWPSVFLGVRERRRSR